MVGHRSVNIIAAIIFNRLYSLIFLFQKKPFMKKGVMLLILSSVIMFACNPDNAKSEQENYELTKENLTMLTKKKLMKSSWKGCTIPVA